MLNQGCWVACQIKNDVDYMEVLNTAPEQRWGTRNQEKFLNGFVSIITYQEGELEKNEIMGSLHQSNQLTVNYMYFSRNVRF